jgi:cell division protein FtsZ
MTGRLRIVGVGGTGGVVVRCLMDRNPGTTPAVAVDHDAQALTAIHSATRIQIASQHRSQHHTGLRRPMSGVTALPVDVPPYPGITRALAGADLVIVTCGVGGRTGTNVAPIVARLAHWAGAAVVGVVSTPLAAEHPGGGVPVELGLAHLRRHTDALVVLPEDRVWRLMTPLGPSCVHAVVPELLASAVEALTTLLHVTPGHEAVDGGALDVLRLGGDASVGTGEARGADRAAAAVANALAGGGLDAEVLAQARGVLVYVEGDARLTLSEVHRVDEIVQGAVATEAMMMLAVVHEPARRDWLRVTVIAVGG